MIYYQALREFRPGVRRMPANCIGNCHELSWDGYISWSKLTHLTEVVSLDCLLCENVIVDYTDEDWAHLREMEPGRPAFTDPDYLLMRCQRERDWQLLAISLEPPVEDIVAFDDRRFQFKGFDLVEDATGISALVNCGGFDKAFLPSDLLLCGLIADYGKARRVRRLLRENYPGEHHANCALWAIWKMEKEA